MTDLRSRTKGSSKEVESKSAISDSLKTLISSKRVMVAIIGFISVVISHVLTHHLGLEAAEADALAEKASTAIMALTGTLIASIGISDHGKAMGKPAGVGHKE